MRHRQIHSGPSTCSVPYGSHKPRVAIAHLKYGLCTLKCIVGLKYTELEDGREGKKVSVIFIFITC